MGTDQSHKNSRQDCGKDMPEFPIATKLKVFYRTCHRAVSIVMQYLCWNICNKMQILLFYCQVQMVFQKFNAVLCSHSLTISALMVSLAIFSVTFDSAGFLVKCVSGISGSSPDMYQRFRFKT